jgi:hypothetical protein
MRTLFAVPWLSPGGRNLLISLLSSLVVVFGAFALLKFNISGKRAPQELVTGSIQKPTVRRSASNDPMAAFLIMPSIYCRH